MTTRRNALALLSLVLLAPFSAAADNAAEPLAIVSSKQGGMAEISLYQLKRLYLGDTVQGPGGELIALNREVKGTERTGFDRSVLGMSPETAARYWVDRRIRGQSGAPKAVEPAAVVQRVVAKLPRAVAYVRVRDVSPDVQVVRIDGKKPGDSGYPIVSGPAKSVAARSFWSGWF
ncbi:MAG TPA: hypothetical protein VGK73_28075 [Polyangiaceae bacterium]